MRSTTFSATVAAKIIRAKACGATHAAAAIAGGISEPTLYRWLRDGDRGREPYKTFLAAFRAATDRYDRKIVEAAARAMEGALSAA